MNSPNAIDGVLVLWGDRLFYPGKRGVHGTQTPKLSADVVRRRAADIRARIAGTVVLRAPQVMVKVTGGGRGMRAIAAHLRYISKNGRLEMVDELGETRRGQDEVRGVLDDWRYGGSYIPDEAAPGQRREAFNIMLSMPRVTDPLAVQRAAQAFAKTELADHKYVMVLHDHQANPHVHLSVRAESKHGIRLNPRKADLARWRETFAEKLRELGVEAEASRQSVRGSMRTSKALWMFKAQQRELQVARSNGRRGIEARCFAVTSKRSLMIWRQVLSALERSESASDRQLASRVRAFAGSTEDRTVEGSAEVELRPSQQTRPHAR